MKILVPIDFTPVTENALRYAVGLTSVMAQDIVPFHVASTEKEVGPAMEQLQQLCDKYTSEGVKPTPLVKSGSYFELIGSTASEIEASLIVMGTHGVKGMQRIIGSYAMKVITNSSTPYIVVQHQPFRPVKKILVPVEFTREVKQMLPFLTSMAEYFKATLYLISESSKDEFIQKQIDNNASYFESYLSDNNIAYVLSKNTFGSSKYKSVKQEADTIGADMIVTTIDPETGLTDYIMGVEEQKIVANESEIPVLCINTKNFMSRTGNIFEYTF
jgi:nucleotide-binding universal stress UspA family protein